MHRTLILLAALALSGCATLENLPLDNRVVCTVARDKAFVVSEWGPVGISSKIADADRAVICSK